MTEARRFIRYLFPGMIFIVLLVLYLFLSATGGPYPQSTVISGVNWQFDNLITSASGSDLWPATWAGDNNVYMTWGDGGGFGGDDTKCRTQFGMAKIEGYPPSLTTMNVYGCKSDDTGCVGTFTHDAACNASYASAILAYGEDIVAVDNSLYAIATHEAVPRYAKIAYSSNFGQTWLEYPWNWPQNAGDWRPDGFVQVGMGLPGQQYIYIVGGKIGDDINTYLARYPLPLYRCQIATNCLGSQPGYQWFVGTPSSPSWGTWANAVPIHTDSSGGTGGHMTYFPVLGRYIFSQAHGIPLKLPKFAMYDAPNPWGPWTTVTYQETWGGYNQATYSLWYSITTKWISADGKTFWMSYSGMGDAPYNLDSFNLVKGTFVLAGEPSPPTGLGVGSYFFGPYFYGTMN